MVPVIKIFVEKHKKLIITKNINDHDQGYAWGGHLATISTFYLDYAINNDMTTTSNLSLMKTYSNQCGYII